MISNFEFNKTQIYQCVEDKATSSMDAFNQNQFFIHKVNDIHNFIQNYWLCDIWFSASSYNSYYNSELKQTINSIETQLNEHTSIIDSNKKINVSQNQYHKRRFLDTIDFESNIARLLTTVKRVLNENKVMIHKKRKSAARRLVSSRRSQYTGVFKNGDNWQTLISIHKRKTYIGTYTKELEAAKIFDFYSILLNGVTAKTNFDYTKKDIIEMIENFVANNGKYAELWKT